MAEEKKTESEPSSIEFSSEGTFTDNIVPSGNSTMFAMLERKVFQLGKTQSGVIIPEDHNQST